jgi:hypothetical protein
LKGEIIMEEKNELRELENEDFGNVEFPIVETESEGIDWEKAGLVGLVVVSGINLGYTVYSIIRDFRAKRRLKKSLAAAESGNDVILEYEEEETEDDEKPKVIPVKKK